MATAARGVPFITSESNLNLAKRRAFISILDLS